MDFQFSVLRYVHYLNSRLTTSSQADSVMSQVLLTVFVQICHNFHMSLRRQIVVLTFFLNILYAKHVLGPTVCNQPNATS